ncbi:hypothetical protein U0070_027374 [Myodes glareolus]|uniref:Uncharacterized protein n=1 Tax=Myodes glareolus TaxID=447135 RepID=A0AAW0J9B7_MYOGA
MIGACLASGLIPSSILCTPVLNSYSAQPNFGAPASPAGSNPARPGGFPGANSPGPVADLYGPASQDSGVGNYISAASPQPGSGFGHGIAVHLPETPELLTSQWGRWSDSWSPSYFSLDVGLVEMTKPGSPPQESLHVWFVAFLTPIGKTK